MNAIDVTDVTQTYGDVTALDGLSLSIEPGTTFGLLGTNGAGKSTLFKLVVGHVRPDTGTVSVAGQNVETAGPAIRSEVGYLPEHAGFPPALTGREVLEFHAKMRGLDDADDRIESVLSLVGLRDAADRRTGGYSNGMNRRLGLATALLSRPTILLLDEPTAGLDPRGVAAFHDVVERLARDDDLTVVLSSHVLSEVEKLCDTVGIVHNGRLRAGGSVEALKRDLIDGVRVRVRLADAGSMADATSVVDEHDGAIRSQSNREFTVECSSEVPPGLLDDLMDAASLSGYEVTEPGLEQVFEHTLGGASKKEQGEDAEEQEREKT
ncbi:ABC-type multidrug transport system, ATPase component [Halogeometricum borinquense DSM 11551]|uniref:ABC-type multidrug transport system, ATPase component n=1 Tax=Halogeometricum borinquense (strain ATCC 700274 / DSM 11551 / JCM 10706 / KCTC 4070 / PR3) TaxID=469382 RepID=E4NU63_HALBP|nr:ABC transporter ATP-binding protein [Halogeometricum borinquense]ADQ68583.1 ABC-type multidrug transport system, ATPase component [Halogeometricum borinquense DSM 11551]ELY25546.1 ABC-type multidrug transport system, ATPase component [Halogeometricum borinquense DSM 11551]